MAHLGYGGHRSIAVPTNGRAPEYLESLKNEFETMTHDLNMYKMQRDDFERKLNAQLSEFQSFQQTLYDLEKNHQRIKTQYEEEILKLRRLLESSGGGNGARELSSPPVFRPNSPIPVPPGSNGPSSLSAQSPLPTRPPSVGGSQSGPPTGLMVDKLLAPPDKRGGFGGSGSLGSGGLNSSGSGGMGPSGPSPSLSGTPAKRTRDDIYGSFTPLSTPGGLGDPKPKAEKREDSLPLPALREKQDTASSRNTMEMLSSAEPPRRPEDAAEDGKDKGSDWIVGYNPGVQTNLNIDLLHNLNHSSVVCCVKFSQDGKYLATGCNKSAQIYDIDTGRKVHTFIDEGVRDGDLYIRSVCFSPDGQHLATGAEDKTVKVWDINHKRVLHTFTGHELDIYSLDFSQDGRFIVSGSGDKKAKIWDIEKGRCAFTLGNEEVGPKDGVTSVAISPDGRLVAAGSLDRIVRLWDAQTGYFLERYEGHADSVYSVAFSPDGKSLASGSLDKTLKLWDLSGSRARSRCRSTFNGHKDFVLSVAFSPDGNWLISGSKDRSVQFWDPRSAVTHMMLQGHKNSVISVALSPSLSRGVFATGSGDYRARLWKFES